MFLVKYLPLIQRLVNRHKRLSLWPSCPTNGIVSLVGYKYMNYLAIIVNNRQIIVQSSLFFLIQTYFYREIVDCLAITCFIDTEKIALSGFYTKLCATPFCIYGIFCIPLQAEK